MQEKIILANLVDANRTVAIPRERIVDVQETEYGCYITLGFTRRGKSIGYGVVESFDKILTQLEG